MRRDGGRVVAVGGHRVADQRGRVAPGRVRNHAHVARVHRAYQRLRSDPRKVSGPCTQSLCMQFQHVQKDWSAFKTRGRRMIVPFGPETAARQRCEGSRNVWEGMRDAQQGKGDDLEQCMRDAEQQSSAPGGTGCGRGRCRSRGSRSGSPPATAGAAGSRPGRSAARARPPGRSRPSGGTRPRCIFAARAHSTCLCFRHDSRVGDSHNFNRKVVEEMCPPTQAMPARALRM